MCKKTVPLILLLEKSTNTLSFEKIKTCANKVCDAVRHCLSETPSFNVKLIVYTFSSDINKSFVNLTSTDNLDLEKCLLQNTISFSKIYEILSKDLSRSEVLNGIESFGLPIIILIADGTSQYVQCTENKEYYYSQNHFLRAAKKIVFSIGESSVNTKESFEMFAGREGVLVCKDDFLIDDFIDALCHVLFTSW